MDALTGGILLTMALTVAAYAVLHGDVLRAYDRWYGARAAAPRRALWPHMAAWGLLLLALVAAPAMTVLVLLGLFVTGYAVLLLLAFSA